MAGLKAAIVILQAIYQGEEFQKHSSLLVNKIVLEDKVFQGMWSS